MIGDRYKLSLNLNHYDGAFALTIYIYMHYMLCPIIYNH